MLSCHPWNMGSQIIPSDPGGGGGGGGDLDLYHMNEFIKNKFEESFYELL